jgi:uncharacterized protein (DUF58 family)
MSFRPTAQLHALAVALAWTLLLAVVLARPEPLVLALPLLAALLRALAAPPDVTPEMALGPVPPLLWEGDPLRVEARVTLGASRPAPALVIRPMLAAPRPLRLGPPPPAGLVRCGEARRWRFAGQGAGSGAADAGTLGVLAWDRAGMWEAEAVLHDARRVEVLPRPLPVRHPPQPLRPRLAFGSHPAGVGAAGSAFAAVAPFHPGDRLRAINWKVSLRRRALHANRFTPEREADLVLLVDCFAEIGARPDSSLDHCLRACAGLAAACLRRRDRVGVLTYGGMAHGLPPAAGPAQYRRILHALAAAGPQPSELAQDLRSLPERLLPRRALVVALSPLADARFSRALAALAGRGQEVALLALDTRELSRPLLPRRRRSRLLWRVWAVEREEQLRALRAAGVRTAGWDPQQPLDGALAMIEHVMRYNYHAV